MRATLTVDLAAIAANYQTLTAFAPGARVAGVIKADAYGLGMAAVAPTLREAGCRDFFVATPEEGDAARTVLGPGPRILVLHGFAASRPEALLGANLIPVLNTPEEIAAWRALAVRKGRTLPTALHVDTGINRLGLPHAALVPGLDLDGLDLVLVMSHLACADQPGNPKNEAQREAFASVLARLPGVPASLANSAGILLGRPYHYDLVRPGIALYGGNPSPSRATPVTTVVSIAAPVLQIRDIAAGETVGYGATYTTAAPARLAVLSIGYADGYLRALGNRGDVAFGGHRAPVVGRVSMDLVTVDVTQVPAHLVHPGAMAELLGAAISVDEVAERAGTIAYEVLTRLGQRLERRYPPAGATRLAGGHSQS